MEDWIIYAIISIFAAGAYNFLFKIASESNHNVSIVNKIAYFTCFCIGFILLILNGDFSFNYYIIILAFCQAILFSLSIFSRVYSMKNIDTVLFFPLYKAFGPIITTVISVIIFKENLVTKEILGIVLGIIVPLLLVTKLENKIQKNLFLGLIFLLLTAILTSITSGINKQIMVSNYNLLLYMVFVFFFGFIFSFFTNNFNNHKNAHYNNKGVVKLGILTGILNVTAFYFFTKALVGNLAIVYTINSFSILIPIILSIIFYKEHFNFRKGFVIALSIISIILFI